MNPWGAAGIATSAWVIGSAFFPFLGPHEWAACRACWRLPPARGIALTFDDGPDPERTPELLDLLASFEVRASFFIVGRRAERHPALVRRIAAEGHLVGNHSFTHRSLVLQRRKSITEELERTQVAIANILGAAPQLVRPPFGHRDLRFYREARRQNLTPVFWSADSLDWTGVAAATVARRLGRACPGDIVLLHDGDARAVGTIGGLRAALIGRHRSAQPIPLLPLDSLCAQASESA